LFTNAHWFGGGKSLVGFQTSLVDTVQWLRVTFSSPGDTLQTYRVSGRFAEHFIPNLRWKWWGRSSTDEGGILDAGS
jgi:hypothetical protein